MSAMVKPGAEPVTVLEQTFHDNLNGLTFQFMKLGGRRGHDAFCLRILGAIPHGNRSYYFNSHGVMSRTFTESDPTKIGQALK